MIKYEDMARAHKRNSAALNICREYGDKKYLKVVAALADSVETGVINNS